jgi:DNA-binding MarR family transcriptional regulator
MRAPTETHDPGLRVPDLLLESPAYVMLRLLRHGKKRAEAAPGGPRLPALMVLAAVEQFGPQSQRELCRRLWLDPSDMVAIVDRLEDAGHAVREVDPADRRRQRIVMTDAGRAWMAETTPVIRGRWLLEGLDDAERDTVVALLRKALAFHDERVPVQTRHERSDSARDGKSEAS